MADTFDPLAYSQSQAAAPPPAFDPLAYSQSGGTDVEPPAPPAAPPSLLDRYLGFQESQLAGATGGVGSLAGGLSYLGRRLEGGTEEEAQAERKAIQDELTYSPRSDEGKKQSAAMSEAASYLGEKPGHAVGGALSSAAAAMGMPPEVSGAAGATGEVLGNLPQFLAGDALNRFAPRLTPTGAPEPTAPESAPRPAQNQSISAAATAPDLSEVSPELRGAIADAGPGANQTALARHLDTEKLTLPEDSSPLRLRKGQATGDAQQISDEKNLRADPDTQGLFTGSIKDQEDKLGASIGEIRREATPDVVQRTNPEHGQAAVDSIKTQDNATVLDIRAKYKALADQNGGDMPLDTGSVIDDIDSKLKKGYLTSTAADNGIVSSVMNDLRSGNPISFEQFENARSGLAQVQRGGAGPEATAAGIVHDALEKMPLTAEAAPLKDLADTARQAAAARFDMIKRNPAYKAAIEDNTPKDPQTGLHVIGAPSPIADSFMDRFALGGGQNASKAYVQRLKAAVPDPALSQSIEAATLNKLRDAAGIDPNGNGTFRSASYRNAQNALAPKADALLSPQSIENTERLKRVSGYVDDEGGKANSVNRSNTAVTLGRFGAVPVEAPTVAGQIASHATDVAAGHLGPVGVITNKIGRAFFKDQQAAKAAKATSDAKLKFAQDATKPGAGLGP